MIPKYMKAYTDLFQSKKLAEILPLKSADMVYVTTGYSMRALPKEDVDAKTYPKVSPCWSLAALLNILPNKTCVYKKTYQNDVVKYQGVMRGNRELFLKDNPIDACYEMILKLHKLNLL